jgi:hypothetical protein
MIILSDLLKARRFFGSYQPNYLNILAILDGPEGRRTVETHNIVTNAGDVYYAQQAANETPTNAFTRLYLTSNGPATPAKGDDWADYSSNLITGANKLPTGTYPKTADADTDNTGAGTNVVTWAYAFTKADFNGTVTHGTITVTSPTGTDPLLTSFEFASSFVKTADDTLKVFVNHALSGV